MLAYARRRILGHLLSGAAAALLAALPGAASAQKPPSTLKVVMHSDLKVIGPKCRQGPGVAHKMLVACRS